VHNSTPPVVRHTQVEPYPDLIRVYGSLAGVSIAAPMTASGHQLPRQLTTGAAAVPLRADSKVAERRGRDGPFPDVSNPSKTARHSITSSARPSCSQIYDGFGLLGPARLPGSPLPHFPDSGPAVSLSPSSRATSWPYEVHLQSLRTHPRRGLPRRAYCSADHQERVGVLRCFLFCIALESSLRTTQIIIRRRNRPFNGTGRGGSAGGHGGQGGGLGFGLGG